MKVFYTKDIDKALRFGDVIVGFISSIPRMTEPTVDSRHPEYSLELSMPKFCAVLSPCCSIGAATITLAPLESVMKAFFQNPYFVEDLTRINGIVPPEKSVSPDVWEKMSDEDKERKLQEKNPFVFLEYFIYDANDIFQKYTYKVRGVDFETRCYMIDFRKSFRVHCPKIVSPENSPLESKILQLSVDTRQQLRDKISKYYSRAPQEDLTLLNAA